jgi:UDP-N-acetyl-D-mannosaminuronate dehydrogenase
MKKIGFIGLGKLGLECAEVFSEKYTVRGYDVVPGSVIVDPWRNLKDIVGCEIIHYGNTRS